MPDGIVSPVGGDLKYINQVPHTDHCVWLPVCLEAYLDETANYSLLDEIIAGFSDEESRSVFERVTNAMRWLVGNRDSRGLSFIDQGDWCDPMNMVGHKGHGVSGWLTIATAHALRLWSAVARSTGRKAIASEMATAADQFADAAQKHLWDGNWFARGISDDGTVFGVRQDAEGKIYMNPQSWAVMSGIASPEQQSRIYAAIDAYLDTPFGAVMLAPAYTGMRENIGRLTQKHPGSAENGAVYNHASTFYIYSLFLSGRSEKAYRELRKMLPGPADEDYAQRGQMPVFVPNYYRGAVRQFPRTAGRSSQMFNTGAASWLYRVIVEQLFGLRGTAEGLSIDPALPPEWMKASATRRFRGAVIEIDIRRRPNCEKMLMTVDGKRWPDNLLRDIDVGRTYKIEIEMPERCG
jgi:cellobionic acid phosphorylase